jgi:TolB-like protein
VERLYPDLDTLRYAKHLQESIEAGHANKSVTDGYSKLKEDVTFRKNVAEQVRIGFELPTERLEVAPNCAPTVGCYQLQRKELKSKIRRVAIFPFQNLASDASLDWLGVGIAETLTGDLRNLDAVSLVTPDVVLRAIPREPSYDIRAVGQKLRADLIVTGSFQRVEDQMRIMSRVLDVPTGEILFTSKLNGEWSHIFDLQDRVVTELLSGLRFKASSSEVAPILSPDTIHLEAYEQYAEGKRLFHRPGRSNLDEAKQRFERALALDPDYAAAHGGLGSNIRDALHSPCRSGRPFAGPHPSATRASVGCRAISTLSLFGLCPLEARKD